jgi:hypothetical protein
VARHWAAAKPRISQSDEDDYRAELAAWGLPDEPGEAAPEGALEVWPANWDALLVFLACATQWRKIIPPMGGSILFDGLRYTEVATVIRMQGHEGTRAGEIFSDVQTMESAALEVLNQCTKNP